MKRILIFLFVIGAFIAPVYAQNMRDYVRRGNRLMLDTLGGSDYSEKAIVQYKKALDMDSTFSISRYNLGNALIRQSKPQEAMTEYLAAAKYETDKNRLSDIYHNMGVLLQSSKKYAEAVECYKESLRNNPSNDETRYNLALAQKQLKDQQQNQQNQDQQQQQQEQKEDKQDQNKDQQEQNQDQQQQPQQQQNKNEMSKENAQQLLNAVMQDEKNVQDKVKKQIQIQGKKLEKDW